jgi:hypothetical protein
MCLNNVDIIGELASSLIPVLLYSSGQTVNITYKNKEFTTTLKQKGALPKKTDQDTVSF